MNRQERRIFRFSRFFSSFNSFSSVFEMAIESDRKQVFSFGNYSRDNVTFNRYLKTV